jgi:hypothetical protein
MLLLLLLRLQHTAAAVLAVARPEPCRALAAAKRFKCICNIEGVLNLLSQTAGTEATSQPGFIYKCCATMDA